jgi:flagellar hook-associated protein 1 FlgK
VATVAVDATAATPAGVVDQINAGLGSLGTASLDATGALQITLNDPGQGLALDEGDSNVAVTDQAGHSWDYGLAHYFGLNDLIVAGRTPTDLAVRPDIAADSSKLSTIALTVAPGPPPVATAGGSGDNRPAQALAAALQRGIDTVARGTMAAGRATLGEYASDIVAVNAASADQAKNAQASVKAVVDDLSYRQGSVSGVNVDEELSKLVLYQQAYSVSARIVSITNQLFDDLMQIGR